MTDDDNSYYGASGAACTSGCSLLGISLRHDKNNEKVICRRRKQFQKQTMKLTKELVPADVLQEIFDSPIPYRDAEEEKLTKVRLCR